MHPAISTWAQDVQPEDEDNEGLEELPAKTADDPLVTISCSSGFADTEYGICSELGIDLKVLTYLASDPQIHPEETPLAQ